MRITINGDAVVLTSTLKVEDIELLKKYKPDALKLTDEDGNQVLAVAYAANRGGLSKTGIVFGGASIDGGYATLTTVLEKEGTFDVETVKEKIADMLGDIPSKLQQIEDAAPVAIADLAAKRATLIDSIQIL